VHEPSFAGRIRDRWIELRSGILKTDRVIALINSMADTLGEAKERNFEIWSGPGEGGEGWWPVPAIFYTFTTYQQEVDYLNWWVEKRLYWMDAHVSELATEVEDGKARVKPSSFNLMQNRPNPFNPSTAISYSLSEPSRVTVEVFNLSGKRAAVFGGQDEKPGLHTVHWNALAVSPGVYVYRITAGRFQEAKKCVLMK
jgi:hypothetical protein